MNKIKTISLLIIASLLIFGACIPGPSKGLLYTGTKYEGAASRDPVPEGKEGEGCMHSVLGAVSWGNASAGAVAQEAGITRISKIDHKTMAVVWIVYRKFCTVVKGS